MFRQILEKFRESIHLASLALYDSQARLELSKWAMKSRDILDQEYSYKTEEFMQYLKDKNIRHLSSEDPEFEALRKKDEYKRQTKIDEYWKILDTDGISIEEGLIDWFELIIYYFGKDISH